MKLRKFLFICVASVSLAFISGSIAAQPSNGTGEILIGQSAGFTGGQAEYSKDVQAGIEAYFSAVNKKGGINGRKLKLVTLDDQGKKELTLINTRKLVDEQKVSALIGYTSGGGVSEVLPYLLDAKVAMLSPVTGNVSIREKFHPYLFHTRAGYTDEMKKIFADMSGNGLKRFAMVVLADAGTANPKMMEAVLKTFKLAPVVSVALDRNATDFAPQINTLLGTKPDAVVFITNGKPLVKVIQGMKAKGFAGQFVTSSFSGIKVIEELGKEAPGLIMSQVLPPPDGASTKLTKEFVQHLKEYSPESKPNYTNLEGYVAARTLGEAIKRAGPPARQKLVDALEGMKKFDMGGYEIDFSDSNHEGSRFVNTAIVNKSGALRF